MENTQYFNYSDNSDVSFVNVSNASMYFIMVSLVSSRYADYVSIAIFTMAAATIHWLSGLIVTGMF